MRKLIKALIAVLLLALFVGMASNFALATPLPPSQPTPTPPPHSGGSSGSYSAPVFQTYTKPLKSSDGTVIGHLDGQDFNSVLVWAEKNATIGNVNYTLTVTGELGSQPSDDWWLDINFKAPDTSGLPKGMNDVQALAVVNVTGNPAGDWGYKQDSLKYSLKVSNASAGPDSTGTYYLIRYDGKNYQTSKIDNVDVASNPMSYLLKFVMSPPGDKGIFTVTAALSPTPTPTPTPTPVPTPTATPLPDNGGMWTFPIFIALFVVGVIVGAAAIFLMMRNR